MQSENTHDLAGSLHGLTLLDESIRTEKHDTDLASFQVHAHALDTRCEPEYKLVRLIEWGQNHLLD